MVSIVVAKKKNPSIVPGKQKREHLCISVAVEWPCSVSFHVLTEASSSFLIVFFYSHLGI